MKRKIYNKLREWKDTSQGTSVLMIEGARRIGKSFIVEEFARNEYDDYLLINFRLAPKEVKEWFDLYLEDLDKLLLNLQLHYNKQLKQRRSVIVFDEVQDCPRAREAIKFLVADGRFDYIETGSLISIKKNVKDIVIPSEEETLEMFPMDFEEFLWAMGNETLMPYIEDRYAKRLPLEQALHRKAMDLFRLYMVVGGMPQSVLRYVETQDFRKVEAVKRQILTLYRNDIHKYADNAENKVTAIFDEIPGQLQKHEKKFRLSAISKDARMRDYDDAFFWLNDARIVNCCYNTTEPSLGLRLNESRTTLKCYMADTGLLISHAFNEKGSVPLEIYQKLILGKLETNEGMLVENIVAQMLASSGHKLFFYSKSSNKDAEERMEIDFLIRKSRVTNRHNISPVEVKSGDRYSLSSLEKCIRKYGPYLSTAFVVHDGDLKVENDIVYLPLYMASLL
ncbi:MAG: ATP-binding protein [Bacteroidales bacterium]|nr:ATP-binding protein [Bacteroidales bacterium]